MNATTYSSASGAITGAMADFARATPETKLSVVTLEAPGMHIRPGSLADRTVKLANSARAVASNNPRTAIIGGAVALAGILVFTNRRKLLRLSNTTLEVVTSPFVHAYQGARATLHAATAPAPIGVHPGQFLEEESHVTVPRRRVPEHAA